MKAPARGDFHLINIACIIFAATVVIIFGIEPAFASEPVVIVASGDDVGKSSLDGGWAIANVRMDNRANEPVTGTLVAQGFVASPFAPPLGIRTFMPITIPPHGTEHLPVVYSRSWSRTEFTFVDRGGRVLSDPTVGDTMVWLGGQYASKRKVALISADAAWAAQLNMQLGYQTQIISNLTNSNLGNYDALIVDFAFKPNAEPERLHWLEDAIRAGRTVMVVKRAGGANLPPELTRLIFNSRSLLSARVSNFDDDDGGALYHGDSQAWLLEEPREDAHAGQGANSWKRQSLLQSSPFKDMVGGSQDNGSVEQSLFEIISSSPPFGVFVILLGAYVVVFIPGTYFVLSRKRRREKAWIILPAAGLILTVIILAIGGVRHGWRDRVAVVEVIRGSGVDEKDDTAITTVRRDIYIGYFSATFGMKQIAIKNVNAASPIPSNGSYNGVFAERGEEAGPIIIQPLVGSEENGLTVDLPILFWAGRGIRFSKTITSATDDTLEADMLNRPEVVVNNGIWAWDGKIVDYKWEWQKHATTTGTQRVVEMAARVPPDGHFIVSIADGVSPDIELPPGANVVVSKRILVKRAP